MMKNRILAPLMLGVCLLLSCATFAQSTYKTTTKNSPDGKFSWQEVENDPTHTRFYTLKNGLTVIISENHLEPRVMALFTTKAGSKNDPATNTGLAHYLEHMLFKGTDRFGSLDYAKEKVELDRIESLYEDYNHTKDKAERKAIYHSIDSISGVAAKLAIANEYDKMMSNIGSTVTNAYTSFENTTYMENVPSDNVEKYLQIQAERMRNPVLRLFHTELEAVYEEKNIGLDNGDNKIFESMFASLFKKHPYGTQTTIGTIEHLKNPSLKEIKKYFYANYVPNNMAMILTGDIDASQTVALIDKYLGAWESKPVPPFKFEPEAPRYAPEEIRVMSPDEEKVAIGFLMPDANSKDAVMADLMGQILYNGKSGLIDKNLVKSQKLLEANGFTFLQKDYGIVFFQARPLTGQTLTQAKDLILEEIENLKKGNFDAALIQGTINNLKVNRIREQENAQNMAFVLNDVFVVGKPWEEYLRGSERMSKITKQDVIEFANKWFGNNYTVVYKQTGEDKTVEKVEKPEIHPVEVNRDAQSDFLKTIVNNPSPSMRPVFLDYSKDIKKADVKQNLPMWYVPNTINGLFSAYYVLDMGKNHNKKLPLAVDYLKLIGTTKMSNEEFNKELYKLAVDLDVFSSDDQVYVQFSGLEENFDKALLLLEDLLNNPKADQAALDKLIGAKIKAREDAVLNKDAIFREAMDSYATYGKVNPFNDVMSNDEMKLIKAKELTDIIKSLPTFKHKVYYYGPRSVEKTLATFQQVHKTPDKLKDLPKEKKYDRAKADENTIYFVDYDMVQAEIMMTRNDQPYDAKMMPKVRAFNEYYGGSMGSVVFQDIRESKALAYSAYSAYRTPQKKEDPFSSMFYVGTQADKLDDAMKAINNLLDNMPMSEKLWETNKRAIKTGYETKRVTKTAILFNYQNALRMGLDHDVRKDIYSQIDQIGLKDIEKFHDDHLKGKAWNIKLLGSRNKIKVENLQKYGKVVELTTKDIFGYDVPKAVVKP